MKINVYGSTLAAWVAAACLAKMGNDVCLQERRVGQKKIRLENLSDISVIRDEPGLREQINQQVESGRLNRVKRTELAEVDVHWLAHEPNDQLLAEKIINAIAIKGSKKSLVINQGNFEVGATAALQAKHSEECPDVLFAYIPDNLEQGNALNGFLQSKRITIGADTNKAIMAAKGLLRPFCQDVEYMQIMSSKEAEFTKFATTGMLAIRLGYINELANLADQLDVDIDVIREGMGGDPRIGRHYLSPGCGFGGQNFHAYISKFSEIFEAKGEQSLLKTVLDENEVQKELLFRKLWQHYESDLIDKKVVIWGASFKAGTASIDNAPSLRVIDALLSQGVEVNVYDPEALDNLLARYGTEAGVFYHTNMYQAAQECDALLLMTEWPEFLSPDYKSLYDVMNRPLIIDGRNVFDKAILEAEGFDYIGVGR